MIYITGDTHGNFRRFEKEYFPAGQSLCPEDYVIVCGDFGIWDETPQSNQGLDWLNDQPFTTLFIDGNHENFDLLNRFPTMAWNGGNVHQVREHIGTLHCIFDNGRTLGVIPGEDSFSVISRPEQTELLENETELFGMKME